MATSALWALPVPSLSDPPNGPAQLLALANAIETAVAGRYAPIVREVGYVEVLTAQTGISATADITGATVTFIAVAGHKYQVQAAVQVQKITTANYVVLSVTDPANANKVVIAENLAINDYATLSAFCRLTPAAGTTTLKLRLSTPSGTVNTALNQPAVVLSVQDLGT